MVNGYIGSIKLTWIPENINKILYNIMWYKNNYEKCIVYK